MNVNESNKRAQAEATNARELNKLNWTNGWSQALIGIVVVLIIVVIVTVGEPNLFWSLMIGAVAVWAGGKLAGVESETLKKALGFWPKVIRTIGWLTIVGVLLLESGFGKWLEASVDSADQAFACWADSKAEGCETATSSRIQCPESHLVRRGAGFYNVYLDHLRPGGDEKICLEAGETYQVLFKPNSGFGHRARLRYDGEPLRLRRRLPPEFVALPDDYTEMVDVAYSGGALVQDTIRIRTNSLSYSRYHVNQPVWFEVYIPNGS